MKKQPKFRTIAVNGQVSLEQIQAARDDFFKRKKTDTVNTWVAEWFCDWFGAKDGQLCNADKQMKENSYEKKRD